MFVIDYIASLSSVSQFAHEREAVKTGVVGIALDKEIVKHHFEIKEIANKHNLIFLEAKLNNENLYEIESNSTPYVASIY